jgi:transcriptional regulator with XRE-family HTH domain
MSITKTETPNGVGAALKFLRTKKNMGVRELARKSGLVHCQICDYEQGESMPSIISITKILDALEIDNLTFTLLTLKARKNRLDESESLEKYTDISKQTQSKLFDLSLN